MNLIKKMSLKHQIWASLVVMLSLTLSIAAIFFLSINAINSELEISTKLGSQIGSAQTAIVIVLIITTIIGVSIAYFISGQINNLLFDVKNSLQSMSDGDFSYQLNESRIGEIGIISMLINNFSSQLNSMIIQLQGATNDLQSSSGKLSLITLEASQNISQQHSETEQVATVSVK